jgi:DMSO/TMAO reductase YedYZ molybdopterin-dependent catalytic subunit
MTRVISIWGSKMNKNLNKLFHKTTVSITLAILLTLSFFSVAALSEPLTYDPNWRITIDGLVNTPLTLSINDLAAMPQTTVTADLTCYGTLVTSGAWTGVTLGQLFAAAQMSTDADTFNFAAQDGYAITISSADHPQWSSIIIAYQRDGQPLTETLRLILPNENGAQWISMITKITLAHGAPDNSISNPVQPTQTQTPTPTTTQTPAPEPENQTGDSSPIPPANDQPVKQNNPSFNSALSYEIPAIVIIVLAVVAVASFLFLKAKKPK